MKSLALLFLFLHLISAGTPLAQEKTESRPLAKNKKLSSVELQWEEYKNAKQYQVQVFNSKKKFLRTFESNSSLIKFKSTSGKVKVRGRFLDIYGKYSDWSELIDVEVPPDAVEFPSPETLSDFPKSIEVQASNKSMKGKVTLTWPEAAQANKYQLKIYDKDKKLVKEITTTKTDLPILLDPGDYNFSITTIGNDNILGKEIYSPQNVSVNSARIPDIPFKLDILDPEKNTFKIQIPKVENVIIAGKLEFTYHLVEKWIVVQEITEVTEFWSPDPKLKPGRYKISFWGTRSGWQDSKAFSHEFVIKPTEESLKEIIN